MGNRSGGLLIRLMFGITVVAVGVVFLLGNMGVINTHEYLRLWPALLIVFGLINIIESRGGGAFSWGVLLVIVGGVMLLDRLYLIHFSLRDYWPLILIFIGVMMILNSSIFHRQPSRLSGENVDGNSFLRASSILGGFQRKSNSHDFRGGDLTTILGGIELDLRDASMDKEAILDVFVMMGGVQMRVPDDWVAVFEGTPMLGGFEDKTRPPKEAVKRLVIRGTIVMGGVEIRN